MPDSENTPLPIQLDSVARDGLFRTKEIAQAITGEGEDVRDIAIRVRSYVNRGHLFPVGRDKDDGRGSLLFGDQSTLTAAVLKETAATGLSNRDAMQKVAHALQTWQGQPIDPNDLQAPKSPAEFIWQTYNQNPTKPPVWELHIRWLRHVETGRREVRAGLNNQGEGFLGFAMELQGFEVTSYMLVPITPLLAPLAAKITNIRKAH